MAKTVFVSGGSRGIGRAVVIAAVNAGWNVAFSYLNQKEQSDRLVEELSRVASDRKVRAFQLDVRDAASVDVIADRVLSDFDGVQAVVPNAGVAVNGLAYSLLDEDWNRVIDTNLTGAFYVCRAFLPELVAQRTGRIVMISSVSAGGATGQAAYAASKAGIIGLTKAFAKEYGPKGITTNALVPGYFDTDMTRGAMSPELSHFAITYCPMRRLGNLDQLAAAVLFLLSDAGGFINGETIRITGGLDWAP